MLSLVETITGMLYSVPRNVQMALLSILEGRMLCGQ